MPKQNIYSHYLRNHSGRFYNYTLRLLITHNDLHAARIRIDGNAKKVFLKETTSYLRKEAPSGTIASLKILDSKKEPLIQLADMVTGAIARNYNNPTASNKNRWLTMLEKKMDKKIWIFS